MSSGGTDGSHSVAKAANPTAIPAVISRACERASFISGSSTITPLTSEATSSTRWLFCVPMAGISTRLTSRAPTIAPKVLAA